TGRWMGPCTRGNGCVSASGVVTPGVSSISSRTILSAGLRRGEAVSGGAGRRERSARFSDMGAGHRVPHPLGLVEEASRFGERQLGGGVRARMLGVGVRLEEQAVEATRHRGAHEREREAAVAAGLAAARALEAVGGIVD